MGKDVAVLDIGSRKLVFALGRKTPTGVYSINYISTSEYDGYYDGAFCSPNTLMDEIKNLISGYNKKMPKYLFVSVPAEFTKITLNSYLLDFKKPKLITSSIIDQLHRRYDNYTQMQNYALISSSDVEYNLDGNKCYAAPIGETATRLTAKISYTLVNKEFVAMFHYIAKTLGFKHVEFIQSQYALGTSYIDENARMFGTISLDVGFCSTSLAILQGQGILKQESTTFGSATICADLAPKIRAKFDEVMKLMDIVNLSDESESTLYPVGTPENTRSFQGIEVNKLIFKLLDYLVEFIENVLSKTSIISDTTPIYMTGGGISQIKGAVMYLEKKLKRRIRVMSVEVPNYNKPYFTSVFAVLDVANEIYQNLSIWNKLF